MSVDSWAWDVEENTDQDWNKGWSNTEFHHNQAKNAGSYTSSYGRSNNNGQSGGQPPRLGVGSLPEEPGPQTTAAHHPNSTAEYFTSSMTSHLPSINNNPYSEVENKEIAPPDHHPQLHGNRHAMKLGVKHQMQGRHDQPGHQGNLHQARNPLPPIQPHPPNNHHQVQHGGDPILRNQPHHSYTDNRKDFFQSDKAASSYFDQASQQQNPPLQKPQPISLPPEHQEPPPNNFFNDHHKSLPQHEPQNINYFQMQDKLENVQNFNRSELPSPREPVDNHQSPKHAIPSQETPLPPDNVNNSPVQNLNMPHETDHNAEQNVNNFNMNQFDDRPPPFQANNIQRGYAHPGGEAVQPSYNDNRMERFGPQGFEEKTDPVGARSQEWNEANMPPSQPHLEIDRPEQGSNRFSGSHHQSDSRTGPHGYFQERPGSQGSAIERSTPRPGPPPLSQERPSSKDFPQALPPSQGSQEWRGPHHKQQTDRANLQNRDWTGPLHTGSQEKLSHQRTASLGSDRSGSVGRDRSSSERSGPSRNNNAQEHMSHWSDSAPAHSDPSGPRKDQSLRRPDDSGPQSEASVTRPDRVPSRSPGAGEDRSPSTKPDNLESLPPEFNITNQISHLSIHPKDKMGDCPLDRNEYLETSQLSNHETLETELRSSRQGSADATTKSHRGERREVVGEAEPLTGRVVVGHTTPTTTPPPHNHHSDELEGGGSGSMERMIPGERREQGSRGNNSGSRSAWRRKQQRRESSYEDDDQDYLSDSRRTHRDDYRREERHRNDRGGQDHRSSDYMSDEEYEIDRRMYSRRDRRFRERDRDREKDYQQDYRRDYYRDDIRSGRRGREYYRYDDDEYSSYRERSRPSSRSESDYRRGNLDYQHRNQSRHYFNPALAGVLGGREYETNPEYFEMLRKTNPVFYAIWYQDYMRKLQDTAAHSAFTQSDRASIHSGQSSGNRLQVSTPSQALDSNLGNVDSFEDYSPRLFSTPHVRGSYDSQGRLVLVNACNPLDGQSASVQVLSVDSVDEDPSIREFLDSPGPFIPGVTHRSSVLQYLKKMSEQAVKSSEKLLYDLVHLIVKSNGKPDAGDISELLLESYRLCKGESKDDWEPEDPTPVMCHQDMLTSFRNLLHQGNKQEALEWAMKNGGWGHALFLSSKMDVRTQARVAAEFARSLAASDPLSTLYQMMSGGVPAAATACSDRRWADWRPHLAMVLSNLTDKPAMDLATITTLADGLASRGRLHAAHSCYIIAQVMFRDLYRGDGPILLGCGDPQLNMASNQCRSSSSDFNYRSFLLTLCYEYAVKQGHPSFFIPALQRYKLLVAWRLVEWGRGRQALLYCELLGSELLASRSQLANSSDLVRLLVELSSSLKSLDPACAHASGDLTSTPDPDWLAQLKQIETSLPQEEVEPAPVPASQPIPDQPTYSNFEGVPHVPMYDYGAIGNMDGMYPNQTRMDEAPVLSIGEPVDQPSSTSTPSKPNELHQVPHQMQQGIQVAPMQPPMQPASIPTMTPYSQPAFSQPPSFTGYEESGATEVDHKAEVGVLKPPVHEPESEPLSLTSNKGTSFFHASDNLVQDLGDASKTGVQKPSSAPAGMSESLKKPDASNGSGGGWFGGILGKLSRKPKNEMILPDDKDPKIVFDAKQNKWVDRDNEGKEGSKDLKPPPMSGHLGMPPVNQGPHPSNSGMPNIPMANPNLPGHLPTATTNIYKMQKGKSMKSNYVDILSNSGGSSKVVGGMDQFLPMAAPHNNKPNYFVPQTVDGSQMHNDGSYQGQRTGQTIPTLYNPANFNS